MQQRASIPFLLTALAIFAGCAAPPAAAPQEPPAADRCWTPIAAGWAADDTWPADADVCGLRLGVAGARSHRVVGLDLPGWWGHTDAPGGGVAVALGGNEAHGSFYGVQLAGGVNTVGPLWPETADNRVVGAQIGLLANFGDCTGLQVGTIAGLPKTHDTHGSDVTGVQVGVVAGTGRTIGVQSAVLTAWSGEVVGVQAALWTLANEIHGCQVGLVNCALDGGGVQLGLLNYNRRGLLPWLPLVNFSVR